MPRTLPFLLALTLTACGTTDATDSVAGNPAGDGVTAADADEFTEVSSNQDAVSGADVNPRPASDAGAIFPDISSSGVPDSETQSVCERFRPVLLSDAQPCPEECPLAFIASWRGGCAPGGETSAALDIDTPFRITCARSLPGAVVDPTNTDVYAFSDGSTFRALDRDGRSVFPDLGGTRYYLGGTNAIVADTCGTVVTW